MNNSKKLFGNKKITCPKCFCEHLLFSEKIDTTISFDFTVRKFWFYCFCRHAIILTEDKLDPLRPCNGSPKLVERKINPLLVDF